MNYRSQNSNQAFGLILLGLIVSLTAIVSIARADASEASPVLADTHYRTTQVMPFSLHTQDSFFKSKAAQLNAMNSAYEYRANYGLLTQADEAAYIQQNRDFQSHMLQEIGDGEFRFYSKRVENKLKENRDLVFVGRYMGYFFAAYLFANGRAVERSVAEDTNVRVQTHLMTQKLPVGPQSGPSAEKANVQLNHRNKATKVVGSVGYGVTQQSVNTSVSRELVTHVSLTLAHQRSLAEAANESRGSLNYSLAF